MRKIFLGVLVLFCMFFNFATSTTLAESKWDQTDVPLNKIWTIKFNSPVNPSTCNENTIKLGYYYRYNKVIYLEKALKVYSSGDNICIAEKLDDDYLPDSKYVLLIDNGVKSVDDESLKEEVKMEFKTVARYIIKFKDRLTLTERDAIISEVDGAEILSVYKYLHIATLTESALKILQQNESIEYIEKDYLAEADAKIGESQH